MRQDRDMNRDRNKGRNTERSKAGSSFKNSSRDNNRVNGRDNNSDNNRNNYRSKSASRDGVRDREPGRDRRQHEKVYSRENKAFETEIDVQSFHDADADKLEGRNPVMEALKSDRSINKVLISKGEKEGSIRQILALAREKGIVVQEVERAALDSLSSTHAHQGVIAFAAVKEYVDIEDILKVAEEKGEAPFIIILDEINDAHNLGSVLRTADAVGAHGVVIPKRRAVGLTSVVAKASAGAVEYVPVARVTNIAQTIEMLKKNNIWVIGTDATGESSFFASDLKGPIALVIGSEGEGMGKLVREKCDFVVNIPMKGQISSLNASVAAAVVMYEILKQRSK